MFIWERRYENNDFCHDVLSNDREISFNLNERETCNHVLLHTILKVSVTLFIYKGIKQQRPSTWTVCPFFSPYFSVANVGFSRWTKQKKVTKCERTRYDSVYLKHVRLDIPAITKSYKRVIWLD